TRATRVRLYGSRPRAGVRAAAAEPGAGDDEHAVRVQRGSGARAGDAAGRARGEPGVRCCRAARDTDPAGYTGKPRIRVLTDNGATCVDHGPGAGNEPAEADLPVRRDPPDRGGVDLRGPG